MQDALYKGRLSFGVPAQKFSHLPAWPTLLKNKKILVRRVWLSAFVISLIVAGWTNQLWEQFSRHWVKALVMWLVISAVIMLIYVIGFFYAMFVNFRNTEREVRKLIYQDLLEKIDEKEMEIISA